MHPTQNASVDPGEIIFSSSTPLQADSQLPIQEKYLEDETLCMNRLLEIARLPDAQSQQVQETAAALVSAVRSNRKRKGGLDAFLKKYDLSSQEGVVLMCLAEALLRVPDAETADRLIADKLSTGNWQEHVGTSDSMFVNASTRRSGHGKPGEFPVPVDVSHGRTRGARIIATGDEDHGAPVCHGPQYY